jgi:hypothetical protein
MRPKLLDAASVVSGRRVAEGELLGRIGNFSQHENGTSYHVHFDIQVPTRAGWVFVSPYMTLVSTYERLIGARGTEISDMVASADNGAITLAAVRQAFLGATETPAPAIAARSHAAAAACSARGLRLRHWRGCAVARIGHGEPPAGAAPAVQGAQIVRHGQAARAAVVAHRTFRRHRS